jgi:hypothetical protein
MQYGGKMKKKPKIKEKLLQQSFDLFIHEMYERLREKEEAGFIGWDKESVVSRNGLVQRASAKLTECALHKRNCAFDAVDIANFMMMLWFRNRGRRMIEYERKHTAEK